jgi:hypothetical protein
MSHRADQILEAVAAAVLQQVQAEGVKVFTHRRLTLQDDQDELPAISVDFGEDVPAREENTQFIDSILNVEVTGCVAAEDEVELRQMMLHLRRQAHVAITADETLGLSFVVNAAYGGAQAPEVDVGGDPLIGTLTAPWLFYYRMNRDDPGD